MVKTYKQVNREERESQSREDYRNKIRKCCLIAIIALLIGFIAYISAINAQNTADINNVFELVVNNTNLAPTIDPSVPGTGERVAETIYYANNSPIELMVFAHANVVGDTATVEVFINGTMVQNQSGRPLGGAEQTYRSVAVIVPKFANYTAHFHNVHHYEWREYPVLSGKNGTLSVNQTFITNLTNSFNATYDQTTKEFNSNYSAQSFPNSSIVTNNNTLNNLTYLLPNLKIGLISDVHCCEATGTKWGNNSMSLLNDTVNKFNTTLKPDIIVLLGDYTNEVNTITDLQNVSYAMSFSNAPVYYVRGNHDAQISDADYKTALGISYTNTSFDFKGYHFIIVDGTSNNQIWLNQSKIDWIQYDLNKTNLPSLVFLHHPIDEQNMTGNYYFPNGDENSTNSELIRDVLEKSKKVVAVFEGHYHWSNYYQRNGINYFDVASLVDSWETPGQSEDAYELVRLDSVGTIQSFNNASLGRNYTFKNQPSHEQIVYSDVADIRIGILEINRTNNRTYIGNNIPPVFDTSLLSVNSSYNPSPPGSPAFTIFGDANKERFNIYSSGNGYIQGRAFGGSDIKSPLWTTSGQNLIGLNGGGYNQTLGNVTGATGLISIVSAETFTDSAFGTYISFQTTQKGTKSRTEKYRMEADGNFTMLTAGKGIILKSPDGTKCGILTWTNADALASTSITCP